LSFMPDYLHRRVANCQWSFASAQCVTAPATSALPLRMGRKPRVLVDPPNRIQALRLAVGLTQSQLAEKAGTAHQTIAKLESGKMAFSDEWKERLAQHLGVDPWSLKWGDADSILEKTDSVDKVPVVGYIGADSLYYADFDAGLWGAIDMVDPPPGSERGLEALIVRGGSMVPAYRNGDLVFFRRWPGKIADLVGDDVVAKLTDGRACLKLLLKGTKPGRFRLESYSKTVAPMLDVEIEWVAPVEHIKRTKR
jgi:transcriptional regulator with XRE-family HTH domain